MVGLLSLKMKMQFVLNSLMKKSMCQDQHVKLMKLPRANSIGSLMWVCLSSSFELKKIIKTLST